MLKLRSIHYYWAKAPRLVRVPALVGLLLLLVASPALAADFQQGQTVTIGPDQVINDDLYVSASNIQILGTVNGDVFAAGNTVNVNGKVAGGLFAAGNSVSVTADVLRGVHVAGGTVTISGPVAQDAVIAGGTVSLVPGASVGRDVVMAAANAALGAPVGRNVWASASTLALAAPVAGDVHAQVGTLQMMDGSRVDGSLTYTSSAEAQIAPTASVGGGIQHLLPTTDTPQPVTPVANVVPTVFDWVKGLVGLAVVGLLLTLLFPRFSEKTVDVAKTARWSSLGVGFGLFIGVPIVAVMVTILGVFVGGWMLGLALLALYAIACAVGFTCAAIVAGNVAVELLRRPVQHLAWNLIEGLLLFGLIGLIPLVGGVLMVVACMYGLGAFALSVIAAYRAAQTVPVESNVPVSTPERPPQLVAA